MKRFLTFLFSFGIILLFGLSVDSHRLPKQIKQELAHAGKDATSTADSGPKQPSQDVANKDAKSAKDNTNTDPNKDTTAVKTGNSQPSQTGSTEQKVKECPAACKPSWLSMVTQYLGTVRDSSHPMCSFKTIFPACTAGSTCSNSIANQPVTTNCCPLRCLKEINPCWTGTGTDSICAPETVPYNIAMKLASAFFGMNG